MSNRFRPAWLLVLAALSTSALAKAPETVNIGYQEANIFALLKYRGTLDESLKEQGIAARWVEFPAGPQVLGELDVGSIDLAAVDDVPPAFAQVAQVDLVYLAHSPASPKTGAIMMSKRSAIHSMADLKGKRVGLSKGSGVNYPLATALEKTGLNYKDIIPVYLPPADARTIFQRGTIDAWAIWDPFLAEVETNVKAQRIRNAEGLAPHYIFYLASRKFVDTCPETAEQVVDELGKLSAWMNSHQDEAAGLLSTSTGLDKAIQLKTLARLPYGTERMAPVVYNGQRTLVGTFTRIGPLSVKVDVRSAT